MTVDDRKCLFDRLYIDNKYIISYNSRSDPAEFFLFLEIKHLHPRNKSILASLYCFNDQSVMENRIMPDFSLDFKLIRKHFDTKGGEY